MAQADWITYGNAGGAKAQQIARLRELFANIGGDFTVGQQWNETGGEDSSGYYSPVAQNAQLAALLQQHGIQGGVLTPTGVLDGRMVRTRSNVRDEWGNNIGDQWAVASGDEFGNTPMQWQTGPVNWGTPTGYRMTLGEMADPEREGKKGAYTLTFNPDGTIGDVSWQNYNLSKGFLGDNLSWLGPLMVGGLAALGSMGAGAAGATGGAPIVESAPSWVAGQAPIVESAPSWVAQAAPITHSAPSWVAQAAPISQSVPTTVLGPDAGLSGAVGGAPISQSAPSWVAPQSAAAAQVAEPSLVERALGFAKAAQPYASLAGTGLSLLGGAQQLGSLPQQPVDAPRLPGAEAPPEARGFLQEGRSPIVDVLNRNRRAGQNRTQLTAVGGVNMASTRVGANSLLGT